MMVEIFVDTMREFGRLLVSPITFLYEYTMSFLWRVNLDPIAVTGLILFYAFLFSGVCYFVKQIYRLIAIVFGKAKAERIEKRRLKNRAMRLEHYHRLEQKERAQEERMYHEGV